MTVSLTPTQELVLDVLAARHRLGEQEWPFDTRHRKAIEGLAATGQVTTRRGNVENTILVSLTDVAVTELMDSDYYPTGFRQQAENIAAFLDGLGVESSAGRIIRAQYGHAALRS